MPCVKLGIYKRQQLLNFQIETLDSQIYEGLFRVFSPRLELTIDVAHLIDPNEPGTSWGPFINDVTPIGPKAVPPPPSGMLKFSVLQQFLMFFTPKLAM